MSRVVLVQKRLERVDPVNFWFSRLSRVSRANYGSCLRRFLRWLNQRPGWEEVGPRELLLRQAEAEDPYELLEMLQEYLSTLDKTRASKQARARSQACGSPSMQRDSSFERLCFYLEARLRLDIEAGYLFELVEEAPSGRLRIRCRS